MVRKEIVVNHKSFLIQTLGAQGKANVCLVGAIVTMSLWLVKKIADGDVAQAPC
jgi:hypothetical protein